MTDYSRMSYEELRKTADDDFNVANISDEEYECLSLELWKKFGADGALSEQYPPARLLLGKTSTPEAPARSVGASVTATAIGP